MRNVSLRDATFTHRSVGTIVGLLAAGRTQDQILRDYPYLEAEDIRAALSYDAWRTEEVELPLP